MIPPLSLSFLQLCLAFTPVSGAFPPLTTSKGFNSHLLLQSSSNKVPQNGELRSCYLVLYMPFKRHSNLRTSQACPHTRQKVWQPGTHFTDPGVANQDSNQKSAPLDYFREKAKNQNHVAKGGGINYAGRRVIHLVDISIHKGEATWVSAQCFVLFSTEEKSQLLMTGLVTLRGPRRKGWEEKGRERSSRQFRGSTSSGAACHFA